ncbi:MAG: hypothetical protein WCV63_08145 [Negativicutes bacterium]
MMILERRFAVFFCLTTLMLLGLFLFWIYSIEQKSRDEFESEIVNHVIPATNKEKFADVVVEIFDLKDFDTRKGSYVIDSSLKIVYDPAEIPENYRFMVYNAQILFQQKVKHDKLPNGKYRDMYLMSTTHNFTPIIEDYPLDQQALTYDLMSQNPFDPYSFRISKLIVPDNLNFGSYALLSSGTALQTAKFNLDDNLNYTTYVSRAYMVIEHSGLLTYFRAFQLQIVSVILALVSFISISDSARFGAIIGSIFVSMNTISSLWGRIREGTSMTILDIESFYYLLVIVGVLVMVSINSRNRYNMDQLANKMSRLRDTNEVEYDKLATEKELYEILIKKYDKLAIVSLNIMFWGFFFGAYCISAF